MQASLALNFTLWCILFAAILLLSSIHLLSSFIIIGVIPFLVTSFPSSVVLNLFFLGGCNVFSLYLSLSSIVLTTFSSLFDSSSVCCSAWLPKVSMIIPIYVSSLFVSASWGFSSCIFTVFLLGIAFRRLVSFRRCFPCSDVLFSKRTYGLAD